MSLRKILWAGTLGTSTMTLFSYAVSKKTGKQFSEPELLEKFLKRKGLKRSSALLSAWVVHYTIGSLFVKIYDLIWKRRSINPKANNGAILGAISGIVAIIVWKNALRSARMLKPIFRNEYYFQLFLAHVIFGITAALTYSNTQNENEKIR